MNQYNCLKNQVFRYGDYHVQPYREEDIFLIKNWRNAQMDVLRQKNTLTDEDQVRYYKSHISDSFSSVNPKIILFSFFNQGKCIGYGGLTNINWEDKRTELSFLLDTERAQNNELYEQDFSAFLYLMKTINFDELSFNRIFTETFDIRPLHISLLEKNGFVLEGRMKEHVCIAGRYVDSLLHGYLKSYYAKK